MRTQDSTRTQSTTYRQAQWRVQSRPVSEEKPGLPSLWQILTQAFRFLKQLVTFARYRLGWQRTVTRSAGTSRPLWMRLPYFKLGMAILALYILVKKDVKFSVNMRAPLAGLSQGATPANNTHQQLGIAPPIAITTSTTAEKVDFPELSERAVDAYVKRFTRVAVAEMEKFGVPASVNMAQALLESEAGLAVVAQDRNNHFGKVLAEGHYTSAWENWRAHSLYLLDKYPGLLQAYNGSYRKWAKKLQEAEGRPSNYAQQLILVIERFQLYRLDEAAL